MNARHVEFHPGAAKDVKDAVAWYRERSARAALDFIEELGRATETIRRARIDGRRGRTILEDFLSGGFLSRLFTPNKNQ